MSAPTNQKSHTLQRPPPPILPKKLKGNWKFLNISHPLFLLGSKISLSPLHTGFPDSSVGKESACIAGEPGLIPGSGRPTGDGMGYPLQYSQASLAAQLVKNPPAMPETWVRSLGWEDPLEKGKATPSSILAWRIPWTV